MAVFSGGKLRFFRAVFSGSDVSFNFATFSGGVSFYLAVSSSGKVDFGFRAVLGQRSRLRRRRDFLLQREVSW
jgi:hypothetical protein